MDKIKKSWIEFVTVSVLADASNDQVKDMEAVYYCGAYAVLHALMDYKGEPTEVEMKDRFMLIHSEIHAYIEKATSRTDSN